MLLGDASTPNGLSDGFDNKSAKSISTRGCRLHVKPLLHSKPQKQSSTRGASCNHKSILDVKTLNASVDLALLYIPLPSVKTTNISFHSTHQFISQRTLNIKNGPIINTCEEW
jgi:hypothetical protein